MMAHSLTVPGARGPDNADTQRLVLSKTGHRHQKDSTFWGYVSCRKELC